MKAEPSSTAKPESKTGLERAAIDAAEPGSIPFEVFPYHVSDRHGRPSTPAVLARDTERADPTDCPSCGGTTENGAGLYTCTACSWAGPR